MYQTSQIVSEAFFSFSIVCFTYILSVHLLSRVWLFATPWIAACQASLVVYPNSCPLSRWCHPPISSSVIPFSSCPQSFPASGSFQMSQLFTSGGQKYWIFSFSISPSNEHPGLISFRMDWLNLLIIQGTLQESSPTPQFKSINSLALSFLYSPTLASILEKP